MITVEDIIEMVKMTDFAEADMELIGTTDEGEQKEIPVVMYIAYGDKAVALREAVKPLREEWESGGVTHMHQTFDEEDGEPEDIDFTDLMERADKKVIN